MTQNSDSGDAAGDAGPTTDDPHDDRFRFKFAYWSGGKPLRRRMILTHSPANFAARSDCADTSVNKSLKSRGALFKYGHRMDPARQLRGALRADEEDCDALG